VEQQVLGVQLVDLLDQPSDHRAGVTPAGAGAVEVIEQGTAIARAPTDLAAVVYVVNGLGAGCSGVSRFARQWGRMYGDAAEVQVPHSVVLIDYLGYAHEIVSLTRDVNELRSAAQKVRGKPFLGGTVEEAYAQNFTNMCSGSPVTNAAERTFELLTAITDALAARPGRKALVWVSPNISMALPSVRRGKELDPFDYMRADRVQRAFERSANSAGVSVYGVDPDLVTWHTKLTSAASSVGPVDRILANPFIGGFSAERNYLSEVSRNTGGRPFIRWSDLPKALRRVERETARFYLLTYAPPDPPEDGEYHEIRVEVTRPGLDVRSRDGYYDIGEVERLRRAEEGRQVLQQTGPLFENGSG
jgi:VWFA-related protein